MKATLQITLQQKLLLIEDAAIAEATRDVSRLREILAVFWDDFSKTPDFSEFDNPVQGELYRIAGFFVSLEGRSRGLADCQQKARDLLTRSIEIFESENLEEKAAESKIILSFSYFNAGEFAECEAILDFIQIEFSENRHHPLFIRSEINRLICYVWNNEIEKGENLVARIGPLVKLCRNELVRGMFHSECGFLFWRSEKFDMAEFHYKEAIRISKRAKITRFVALNLNNLAILQSSRGEFPEAKDLAFQALKIYQKLGDTGWTAHVFDTIAQIYFDQNNYSSSLEYLDKALQIFEKSEDTHGLLNALFSRTKNLLRLGETKKALLTFGELSQIARHKISEKSAENYAAALEKEFYVIGAGGFHEEVADFKKKLLTDALVATGGKITKAAQKLRIEKHQTLSDMLKMQFPTLRDNLGFKQKAKRKQSPRSRTVILNPEDVLQEKVISRLILPAKSFSFDFDLGSEQFEIFYFDRFLMEFFGVDEGAIVVTIPTETFRENLMIIVSDNETFKVGRTEYDRVCDIFYIKDESDEWIPLSAENVIGSPVAYCRFSDSKKSIIKFERLEIF